MLCVAVKHDLTKSADRWLCSFLFLLLILLLFIFFILFDSCFLTLQWRFARAYHVHSRIALDAFGIKQCWASHLVYIFIYFFIIIFIVIIIYFVILLLKVSSQKSKSIFNELLKRISFLKFQICFFFSLYIHYTVYLSVYLLNKYKYYFCWLIICINN